MKKEKNNNYEIDKTFKNTQNIVSEMEDERKKYNSIFFEDIIFKNIENKIDELQKILPEINLLDNYNHRSLRMLRVLKTVGNDIELNKKRLKEDAGCPSLKLEKIEFKTKTMKNMKINSNNIFKTAFMFDKQDRAQRREYILKTDALVFGVFVKEKLLFQIGTKDENVLKEYREICVKKQEKFIKEGSKKQKEKKGNGGHDSIQISLLEFNELSLWNFYFDEKIYINGSLKDIKDFLREYIN